jgi:hypothetical protein
MTGPNIEKPDDRLYDLIKKIYDDIASELELATPYDPNVFLGGERQKQYSFRRALVESLQGGSDYFVSEGVLSRQPIQVPPGIPQLAIADSRNFEGWKHEDA